MKLFRFRIAFILILVCFSSEGFSGPFRFLFPSPKSQDTAKYVSPYFEDNERCLKCHGQEKYEYTNETLGRQVRALMCSQRIVNRELFYQSNHKSFSCTDCHSGEYVNFPHAGELRMEEKYSCIACHGGDEKFAQYHFEAIDSEYVQSTHYKLEEDGFSCWKCHNPHTYKINNRTTENIKETIRYDNAICLSCHSDFNHFQLLSDREEINILKTHEWLPNQTAHFQNVRCIECHTTINNNILVSHQIRPKKEAVRRCNECHSQNSILMATLYKFQSKEQRRSGFFNGIILNESYVIGANRNEFLNLISFGILGMVLFGIAVHIVMRVRKSKQNY
jgi:predicted CXXCH cytochrome family protein